MVYRIAYRYVKNPIDASVRSEMQKEIQTVIVFPRECADIIRTVNLMEQVAAQEPAAEQEIPELSVPIKEGPVMG